MLVCVYGMLVRLIYSCACDILVHMIYDMLVRVICLCLQIAVNVEEKKARTRFLFHI